jgi:hypothetical protein
MPSAPVEELAPVRTQPREHVLEIGCRGRAGRERGWIERPTTEREQHQCAYAASNLKRTLGNVLVRDSITGKMRSSVETRISAPFPSACFATLGLKVLPLFGLNTTFWHTPLGMICCQEQLG